MSLSSQKEKLFRHLGALARKFELFDRLIKWGIHLFAIFRSGRYTRGSLCVISDPVGRLLLVETTYKRGLGFVGGLPNSRKEPAVATAKREVKEEVGVELSSTPAFLGIHIQTHVNHIDAVFATSLTASEAEAVKTSDSELANIGWYQHQEVSELLDPNGQAVLKLFTDWQTNS